MVHLRRSGPTRTRFPAQGAGGRSRGRRRSRPRRRGSRRHSRFLGKNSWTQPERPSRRRSGFRWRRSAQSRRVSRLDRHSFRQFRPPPNRRPALGNHRRDGLGVGAGLYLSGSSRIGIARRALGYPADGSGHRHSAKSYELAFRADPILPGPSSTLTEFGLRFWSGDRRLTPS